MKLSDLDTYVGWVREAQGRFPRLSIKLGLEVDFLPGCEDWVRDLAARQPWDYFFGSVHFVGDWLMDYSAQEWKGRNVEAGWRDYFELWKQAARSRLFDSLPHPDLPKKFGVRPKTDFAAVFEEALRVVAASDVAIEVSTAGLRKPCREIYPSLEFLRIAHRFGIPVQLGSDAHIPQDVGRDFDQATAHLRAAGYGQIAQFTGRQRKLMPLG
jgi:histidinol-phosphatase (PHP family)